MNTELKERLLREGRLKGMCTENLEKLRECSDRDSAIALYKKTIDWALENNYPSLEILREHFADCKKNGMYVDYEFDGETLSRHQVYVLHNCKGVINVGWNRTNATIPMIYVANGSDVTFSCNERIYPAIRVPVYATEDCRVRINKTPNANFTVYKIKEGVQ